jgi:hypothetical protein
MITAPTRSVKATILLVLIAIAGTALPLMGQFYGDRQAGWLMVDFRSYYCAALSERSGKDPYFAQPLHECENQTPSPFFRAKSNVTVPAPYPPYALAVVYPFTFLPFTKAVTVWASLMALLCVIATVALAAVTRLPLLAAWGAFALSLGLESLPSGQIVPLCIASLLLAAYLVQRGQDAFAALFVAVAMIEPHVALPAAVALLIARPNATLVLVLALGLIGIGSLAFGGEQLNVEYFTKVLPAHALAEVSRDNQFSLSTVLASFGVADSTAIFAGNVCYLLMLVVGCLIGSLLMNRYGDSGFLILTPPAFTLLGGSFVHTVEMVAAIPVCLLLYVHLPQHRVLLGFISIALAMPWMDATSASLLLAPVFPAAFLTYVLIAEQPLWLLRTAVVSGVVILSLFILAQQHLGGAHQVSSYHPPIDPHLAEYYWRQLVLGNTTNRPVMWLLRLPTWAALVALLVTAGLVTRKTDVPLAVHSL